MAKISIEEARLRVRTELEKEMDNSSSSRKGKKHIDVEFVDTINDNLYLFNGNGTSVISPDDDAFDPILTTFDMETDVSNIPPALKLFLDFYSKEIEDYQTHEDVQSLYTIQSVDNENAEEPSLRKGVSSAIGLDDMVDLGLPSGTKWSSRNFGAANPYEIGGYYAWGELSTKNTYTLSNYSYYDASKSSYNNTGTLYTNYIDIGYGISRNANHDPSYQVVDDEIICMPTKSQWSELFAYCSFMKTKLNDVDGYEIKSVVNGNTIFLPFTGYKGTTLSDYKNDNTSVSNLTKPISCLYMLSNRDENPQYSFTGRIIAGKMSINTNSRYFGRCIRPVCVPVKTVRNPMIPYKWGQGSWQYKPNHPYNVFNRLLEYDPVYKSNSYGEPSGVNKGKVKVITGCPATALSMIVGYYGCYRNCRVGIKKIESYKSYEGTSYELKLPELGELKEFDYANLIYNTKEEIANKSGETDDTNPRIQAVGNLMKYIGYALQTEYRYNSSGAWIHDVAKIANEKLAKFSIDENGKYVSVPFAKDPKLYCDFTKFGNKTMYFPGTNKTFPQKAQELKVSRDELMFSIIAEEVEKGHPVVMQGYTQYDEKNVKFKSGHVFICDGYDSSTNKFHFNFGWCGYGDCWTYSHLVVPNTPQNENYRFNKGCITDLHPVGFKRGDVNMDGEMNITDLIITSRLIEKFLGLVDKVNYNPLMDMNRDGVINAIDSQFILDRILGRDPYVLEVKYDVETSGNIQLYNSSNNPSAMFTEMKIDGSIVPFALSGKYQLSEGEHTVKYTLRNESLIFDNMFKGCTEITDVTIPNCVTTIGDNAFQDCGKLVNINIIKGISKIGDNAFDGCSSLKKINIPYTLSVFGNDVFKGCSNITHVEINSNTFLSKKYTTEYNMKTIFGNQVTKYAIGDYVKTIGICAFYKCSNMTEITFGENIKTISASAFSGCAGLTSIELPDTLTTMDSYAFLNCTQLARIVCDAKKAPTIKASTFQNVHKDGILDVPYSSTGYDVWMGTGNYYLGHYNWSKQ